MKFKFKSMKFKFKALSKFGLTITLAVIGSTLSFQPAALAWKITRTGRALPVNQSLSIGGKDFSCGNNYGFLPGATLENSGRTSTIFFDPFCFPEGSDVSPSGGKVSFSFETTSQGVKTGLIYFNPYNGGFSEFTDIWTLEGYIEQVSKGNGVYAKNFFIGEGVEQIYRTSPSSQFPNGEFNQGSAGIPIGSNPNLVSNFSVESSYFTDEPTLDDYGALWSPNSGSRYLMQPSYGTYYPNGGVVSDSFNLFAYNFAEGSDGKGIVTKVSEVVKSDVTRPTEKGLFTGGLLLDDSSKPSETSEAPQDKPSSELQFESVKSILENSLKIFKSDINVIDKKTIVAQFNPQGKDIGKVPLASLAKAMGYSSFNWLQIISQVPPNTDWFTGTGLQVVDDGKIINTATGKFFDPSFQGQKICSHGEPNSVHCGEVKTDTKDFYFDIPGFGGTDAPYMEAIQNNFLSSTLLYIDTPSMPFNPGVPLKFTTKLVGIREGDNSYNTYDEIPGFKFNWQSTYRCATKECNDKAGQLFRTATSLGLNLSDIYSSLGLTANDFTGEIIILDDNGNIPISTSVPEPSNLPALQILGSIVAVKALRKKRLVGK